MRPLVIEQNDEPTHCCLIEQIPKIKDIWYADIQNLFKDGSFPNRMIEFLYATWLCNIFYAVKSYTNDFTMESTCFVSPIVKPTNY